MGQAGRYPKPPKVRPWEGPAQLNQYLLRGHQSPSLIDPRPTAGKWTKQAPSEPRCLPSAASGPIPRKIPSLGPFPAGPKPTQGTPSWCGGAGRPRDGGLLSTPKTEWKAAQDPPGLGQTQPTLSVKPSSSQSLAKLETQGKPPLTCWAWVPIRWIIAELLFQEMSEGRREKTPQGSPGADHAQR